DDVRIALFDLFDRLASRAQACGNRHIRFGVDPARQQAARDNRVIDDHHLDAPVEGDRRTWVVGTDDTHGTRTFDTQLWHPDVLQPDARSPRWALRSVRLPGTWPRRCPCRTVS